MLFRKVAIVGVGLIGGSLGAALKARKLAGEVLGIGYRNCTLEQAQQRGCIDDLTLNLTEGVADADLVVIATPVGLVAEKARQMAPSIPADCIVTDVASTKRLIAEQLDEIFAGRARFVGAHPMAGSEKRGAVNSAEDLFDGALCILTRTPNTDEAALGRVGELWRSVGARTRVMTPAEHDHYVALASHIPHVAVACLVNIQNEASLDCGASGFADTTRIAGSDPALWRDICLDNLSEIVAGIDRLRQELATMQALIKNGDREGIFRKLDQAARRRREWADRQGQPGRHNPSGGR